MLTDPFNLGLTPYLEQSEKLNNHIKQKAQQYLLNFRLVVDRGIEPLCQD